MQKAGKHLSGTLSDNGSAEMVLTNEGVYTVCINATDAPLRLTINNNDYGVFSGFEVIPIGYLSGNNQQVLKVANETNAPAAFHLWTVLT